MLLIVAFLLLVLAQCGLLVWATVEVRRFLREHAAIDGPQALEAFKALARRNMHGALLLLACGAASLVLAVLLVLRYELHGVLLAAGTYAVHGLLTVNLARYERRSRALESTDPVLAEVHRAVAVSWRKKMLPDF